MMILRSVPTVAIMASLASQVLVEGFAPAPRSAVVRATATTTTTVPVLANTMTDTVSSSSSSSSALMAGMLTETELPEKLYFPKEKETPEVLGGLQIGLRKLVVVTGASSGLGLNAAATLAKTGRHFVVMACRNVEKGKAGK